MRRDVPIRVLEYAHGLHPEVVSLNPRFRPEAAKIKLQVEIDWKPRKPAQALDSLQDALAEFSPSLRRHQCRGLLAYRIHGTAGNGHGGPGDPSPESARGSAPATDEAERGVPAGDLESPHLEAPLALAHLLEHVMIDAVASVSGEPLVSGITGARRGSKRHFDIFVECPDANLTPLIVQASVAELLAVLHGGASDPTPRAALDLAQRIYQRRPAGVGLDALACSVADPDEFARALEWLESSGFARRREGSMYHASTPPNRRRA